MTDDPRPKRPIDAALDVVLYAPIGLLASAREVVPELAAKGREVVEQQVTVARFVGRLAVRQGQRQASATAERVLTREYVDEDTPDEQIPVRLERVVMDGADRVTADAVGADELAIPSYDSLAASQVVARLGGLTAEELDAVGRYEQAHRGRKTVLGKVAQLQSG
jgi:hypothetical protein